MCQAACGFEYYADGSPFGHGGHLFSNCMFQNSRWHFSDVSQNKPTSNSAVTFNLNHTMDASEAACELHAIVIVNSRINNKTRTKRQQQTENGIQINIIQN